LAADEPGVPRVVLLVGGPGNGKTEAVETTTEHLDAALGCNGTLLGALATSFHPSSGIVDRVVQVDAGSLSQPRRELSLSIVADASVGGRGDDTPASLLVDELIAATSSRNSAYLCCVNRGVLDDAMIHAIDVGLIEVQNLLDEVVRAASMAPDAPPCWPPSRLPMAPFLPLDAESRIEETGHGGEPPARQILRRAVDPALWETYGACAAGTACPFCTSRRMLDRRREATSLLRLLRWFELGTSKRWAFRDLFS